MQQECARIQRDRIGLRPSHTLVAIDRERAIERAFRVVETSDHPVAFRENSRAAGNAPPLTSAFEEPQSALRRLDPSFTDAEERDAVPQMRGDPFVAKLLDRLERGEQPSPALAEEARVAPERAQATRNPRCQRRVAGLRVRPRHRGSRVVDLGLDLRQPMHSRRRLV